MQVNELQISLAVIGAVVIAGVYAFNRFQEKKYQRHSEETFSRGSEDVLLDARDQETAADTDFESPPVEPALLRTGEESRREPSFSHSGAQEPPLPEAVPEPEEIPVTDSFEPVTHTLPEAGGDLPDSATEAVDYMVTLYPKETPAGEIAWSFERNFSGFGGVARCLGKNMLTGAWEILTTDHAARCTRLVLALQLASRAGPVKRADLDDFCIRAQAMADALNVMIDFPDKEEALARAVEVDDFCASVDVQMGVNVLTSNGDAIPATKIRALAEASGMKFQDGLFHYRNDEGVLLFSLGNFEPVPFSAENFRHLSTHGVTLLLDVPKVPNGLRVFDQMLVLARQMASSLGGVLVDDNRRPLSDTGIAKIKQQLSGIYASMDAAGVRSGSESAARLFA